MGRRGQGSEDRASVGPGRARPRSQSLRAAPGMADHGFPERQANPTSLAGTRWRGRLQRGAASPGAVRQCRSQQAFVGITQRSGQTVTGRTAFRHAAGVNALTAGVDAAKRDRKVGRGTSGASPQGEWNIRGGAVATASCSHACEWSSAGVQPGMVVNADLSFRPWRRQEYRQIVATGSECSTFDQSRPGLAAGLHDRAGASDFSL